MATELLIPVYDIGGLVQDATLGHKKGRPQSRL